MIITKEQIDILKQFDKLGIIDNFKEVIRVLLIVKNAKDYNTCLEQFNTFKISNIYENTDNFKYFKDWEQLIYDVGMIDNFCFDKSKIKYNVYCEPTLSSFYTDKVYSSNVEGLCFGDIYFSNAIFLTGKFDGEKLIKLSKINMSCFHNLSFDNIYNIITQYLDIVEKEEIENVLTITTNIFDVLYSYKFLSDFKMLLLKNEGNNILGIYHAPHKHNWEYKIPCLFITGDITIGFIDFLTTEFLNDDLFLEKYLQTLNNLDITCFKNLPINVIIKAIDLYLLNKK